MGSVPRENTSSEMLVRKALFAAGFRFRVNDKRYPGSPDIVLPKYKAAIFVHGCFWHQHEGCPKSRRPGTRKEFWNQKFEANIQRDKRNVEQLKTMGWRVATVWECSIKDRTMFNQSIAALVNWIRSAESEIVVPKGDLKA